MLKGHKAEIVSVHSKFKRDHFDIRSDSKGGLSLNILGYSLVI